MSIARFLRYVIFASACVATHAHAQVDSFSLNFEKVKVDYATAETGPVPFGLDLVHGEDGSIGVVPVRGHDLAFEGGQFYRADPHPESWLYFQMKGRRGATGLLGVGIDQSGVERSAGGHVRVFSGSSLGGASLHVGGVHTLLGDGSVRFISDSVDVRLSGEPAELFNQPGPGEPLEAYLPTPAPGQTIEMKLRVSDDRGASMTMPVRIARPR